MHSWSATQLDPFPENGSERGRHGCGAPPTGCRFLDPSRDNERGYALRRKSTARTRARNCSGVSGIISGGGAGAGAGSTAAGAAG